MEAHLERFWELLETNFPLGGPRRYLVELLGTELVAQLEALRILRYQHASDVYPCPRPSGDNCPRAIIPVANGLRAVCGNEPEECSGLFLSPEDASHLAVDPLGLGAAIARALQVRGTTEAVPSLRHVLRVGTFKPEPDIKHPVYFVVRCEQSDYAELFDAIRSRQSESAFALLVPTDRFVGEDTVRQMRALGVPVLPLADTLNIALGQLAPRVDPLRYFASIGRPSSVPSPLTQAVVAQALVCSGSGQPTWRNLDEREYQELVAAASEYEIFADERARTAARMSKGKSQRRNKLQASYFQVLRACAEHRGYYDPGTDSKFESEYVDPKQTFVRARNAIDIKFKQPGGQDDWKLFKTRIMDKAARYEFAPEPGVRYVLIFQPRS